MSHLKSQLLRCRDLIADITRRNKELYFRENRSTSVNLTKLPFNAANTSLELQQRYSPLRTASDSTKALLGNSALDLSQHFLFDQIENKNLHKRLDKMRLADNKYQREFGISGAWLLGPFICWRGGTTFSREDMLISPIFKIPVDLEISKKKQWILRLEDTSLRTNPSLALLLKQRWGIELPELFEQDLIADAVSQLISLFRESKKTLATQNDLMAVPKIPPRLKIIKDESGEIIERRPVALEEELTPSELALYDSVTSHDFRIIDAFYIDHISASRMALFNDYESIIGAEPPHPILSEMFLGRTATDGSKTKTPRELDAYRERENHFVIDIDSTQHRAIDKSRMTRTVVIQGPPGTGKSQTITNLIAETLAKGKTVLFVSEKRAALDVVYSRIRKAGIEKQTVLLHSSDLNKNDLYKSFLELSESQPSFHEKRNWVKTTDDLDRTKGSMNAYFDCLLSTHSPSELVIADILAISARKSSNKRTIALGKLFCGFSYEAIESLKLPLEQLQRLISSVPHYESHPWLFRKSSTVFSSTFGYEMEQLAEAFSTNMAIVSKVEESLRSTVGPSSETTIEVVRSRIAHVLSLQPMTKDYSALWNKPMGSLVRSEVLDELSTLREVLRENVACFRTFKSDCDPSAVKTLGEYYKQPRGFIDCFTAEYWRKRNLAKSIANSNIDLSSDRVFRGYEIYVNAWRRVCEIGASLGLSQLAQTNQDERDKALEEIGRDLSRFFDIQDLRMTLSDNLSKRQWAGAEDYASYRRFLTTNLELIERRTSALSELESIKSSISSYLSRSPHWGPDHLKDDQTIKNLVSTLPDLSTIDSIDMLIEDCESRFGLSELKKVITTHLMPISEPWGDYLEQEVVALWADECMTKNSSIRAFDKNQFESQLAEFLKLETRHREVASQAVNNAFAERWEAEPRDHQSISLLKKESQKQRKVLSPREVMERGALKTMMTLKPCWLMSPLSISQMLPLKSEMFDIIIFDEASQVRVEEAIPSIYRAQKMVVVGDPKQMPPTNFFFSGAPDDEEEDNDIPQSVLDLAMQVYPAEVLEWHYRSRYEALIAFSNRAFYGGRLIAVPNPHLLTESGAIEFIQLTDATFTSKEGNPKESEAVVNRLAEILKEFPDSSVGIIALGTGQQAALDAAIEQRKTNDASFAERLEHCSNLKEGDADVGFFCKNLENVQGDERDIILISVGYGPSQQGREVRLGFGPLSQKGGGRRLNVAITRAKKRIIVCTSFSPDRVPVDEEAFARNPDSATFGRYLKYARAVGNKQYAEAMNVLNSFGVSGVITGRKVNRFAGDVKRRLEERGYKVSAEIGSSGFYVDLAIHHPVIPSNFILGVECDGALFHSTPYARDRDKLRQNLLESRGWRIERIWSQDWSRNWKQEIEKIEQVIRRLQAPAGTSVNVPAEQPTVVDVAINRVASHETNLQGIDLIVTPEVCVRLVEWNEKAKKMTNTRELILLRPIQNIAYQFSKGRHVDPTVLKSAEEGLKRALELGFDPKKAA